MYDRTTSTTLEYHAAMLRDTGRVEAFRAAIGESVRPGDVVVDLGCGTGLLSLFACQAGAGRVHAIEVGRVIELARAIVARNGCADRVSLHKGLSKDVRLDERADVLVTETVGNLGLEEGIVDWVIDARARLLKPGAVIIPAAIDLYVALAEVPEEYDHLDWWSQPLHGLDVSPGRTYAVNVLHPVSIAPDRLLCAPSRAVSVNLATVTEARVTAEVTVTVTRSGTVHGVGGWFGAQLSPSVALTNAPPLTVPSWRQVLLALAQPLAVQAGDQVVVRLAMWANGSVWRWSVRHVGPEGAPVAIDQSTFSGQLVELEALHRRSTEHVPVLSAKGRRDRAILDAMDGAASVGEIAARVGAEVSDPGLEPDDVLERVRGLAERYGQ